MWNGCARWKTTRQWKYGNKHDLKYPVEWYAGIPSNRIGVDCTWVTREVQVGVEHVNVSTSLFILHPFWKSTRHFNIASHLFWLNSNLLRLGDTRGKSFSDGVTRLTERIFHRFLFKRLLSRLLHHVNINVQVVGLLLTQKTKMDPISLVLLNVKPNLNHSSIINESAPGSRAPNHAWEREGHKLYRIARDTTLTQLKLEANPR